MDSSDLQKMGRRRFMENLAGIGVSATTVQNISQEELAQLTEDPEEEMPYVEAYANRGRRENGAVSREPIFDTIDRNKWERIQTALNARDEVSKRVGEKAVVSSRYDDQSPTDFGIYVDVPVESEVKPEEIEAMLPSTLRGSVPGQEVAHENIPVVVGESEHNLTGCYDSSPSYDEIPAGTAISTNIEGGTLNGPFHSYDHGDGWVTAGHVVEDDSGTYDVFIDTSDGFIEFGTPHDTHYDKIDLDYTFIEPTNSSRSPSAWITNSNSQNKDLEIGGILSDEALENHIGDESYNLQTQGRASCRSDGYITDVNGFGTSSVTTTHPVGPGDSGGPLFRELDGVAFIAGDVFKEAPEGAQSTTAETVEEKLNGFFMADT